MGTMRKLPKNKLVWILLLVVLGTTPLAAYSQKKTILQLADEYAVALKKYEALKQRTSVEKVFRKGNAAASKLEEMENLNDEDYDRLEKKLRGFEINRMEVVFIVPDAKFFARLVKKHGTRADAAYFKLIGRIRPENVWPAYMEQQTDYSGCTKYGGTLTPLYAKALQFKRTYPHSYTAYIDSEIEEIISQLRKGDCACGGDRASVEKEFRLFIKTFPNDKNTPAIKKRIAALRKKGYFRFNCTSG